MADRVLRVWRAGRLLWWCLCAGLAAPALQASEFSVPLSEPVPALDEVGPAALQVQNPDPDPVSQAGRHSLGPGLSPPSKQPVVHWPGDVDPAADTSVSPMGLRANTAALPGLVSGVASWYGPGFHGRPTASGELFSRDDMTAAHRTLPMGTLLHVTNANTGVGVVVRINDRGPFHSNRVIDLSQAAASALGIMAKGVGRVELRLPSDDEAVTFARRLAEVAREKVTPKAAPGRSGQAVVPRRSPPKPHRPNPSLR